MIAMNATSEEFANPGRELERRALGYPSHASIIVDASSSWLTAR
jgi:hypothetical protein